MAEVCESIRGFDPEADRRHCFGLSLWVFLAQLFGALLLWAGYQLLAHVPPGTSRYLSAITFLAFLGVVLPWCFWWDEITKFLNNAAEAILEFIDVSPRLSEPTSLHHSIRKERLQFATLLLVIVDTFIVFVAMLLTGGPGGSVYDPLLVAIPVIAIILRQPRRTVKWALGLQVLWGFLLLRHWSLVDPEPLIGRYVGAVVYQSHQDPKFYLGLQVVVFGSLLLSIVEALFVHGHLKLPRPSPTAVTLKGYINHLGERSPPWLQEEIDWYLRERRFQNRAVKKGARDWVLLLDWLGVSPYHASRVHDLDNVYIQALLLSLPYWTPDLSQRRTKAKKITYAIAFLTFAAHWLDDLFDAIKYHWDSDELRSSVFVKHDLKDLTAAVPKLGRVIAEMKMRVGTPNSDQVDRAIQRIIAGGFIQNEDDVKGLEQKLQRYIELILKGVTSYVIQGAMKEGGLRLATWVTTKTVMELLHCCDDNFNQNVAEAYNILYGPILYYQDREEEAKEEGFGTAMLTSGLPQETEMLELVAAYKKFIDSNESTEKWELRRARMKQLDALVWVYGSSLPSELRSQYMALVREFGKNKSDKPAVT